MDDMNNEDSGYAESGDIEKSEFICNRCGYCCTDESTQINISLLDLKWLSDVLKMRVKDLFLKDIVSFIPFVSDDDFTKYDVEFGIKRPCPMYENNKCTIYQGRPTNCRIFPYWLITHKVEDEDIPCLKGLKIDPMTDFKYKMYENMIGSMILEESRLTEEFIAKIGVDQKIDISKDNDAKKLIDLFKKTKDIDGKKAQGYAQKLMKIAESKVDKVKLLEKIDLIENEVNKTNFDEKINTIINAEALLDSDIMDVNFK